MVLSRAKIVSKLHYKTRPESRDNIPDTRLRFAKAVSATHRVRQPGMSYEKCGYRYSVPGLATDLTSLPNRPSRDSSGMPAADTEAEDVSLIATSRPQLLCRAARHGLGDMRPDRDPLQRLERHRDSRPPIGR